MPLTWNNSLKYFEASGISPIYQENDLIALKGNPISQQDTIYCFDYGYVQLKNNSDLDINQIYLGDNYQGIASIKTGFCDIIKPGRTVNIWSSVANTGLGGEGTTSQYILQGTALNPMTIVGKVSNTISDYNTRNCACDYQHVRFDNVASITCNSAMRKFYDCIIKNSVGTYCWVFYAEPFQFEECGVQDQSVSSKMFHINNAISTPTYNDLLEAFIVINTGAAKGGCVTAVDIPTGTWYYSFRRGPDPTGFPVETRLMIALLQLIFAKVYED